MKPSNSTLPLTSLLLVLGVTVVWGANFIAVKIGLEQIPPLTLCALRFFLASFPAILFVPRPNVPIKYILIYGLATFAIQFALLFSGMAAGLTPGMAALISQTQVFFAIFFAYLFANQTIDRWQMLGSIVSFLGIVIIGFNCNNTSCTLLGFTLAISAAIFWGLGNLVSTKLQSINMLSMIIWSSFIAFIPLFGLACITENPMQILSHPENITLASILSIAYITYASTHFGYGSWSWLISKHSMPMIAPFALLCPIIALALSAIVLQETFESWKMLASLLVVSGLAMNILGPKIAVKLTLFLGLLDRTN